IMPLWVVYYLVGTGILAAVSYVTRETYVSGWESVVLVAVPLQGTVWLCVLIAGIRRWVGNRAPRFMPRWVKIYVTVAGILAVANCIFWETTAHGAKYDWWVCTLLFGGYLQTPLWLFLLAQAIWLSLRR